MKFKTISLLLIASLALVSCGKNSVKVLDGKSDSSGSKANGSSSDDDDDTDTKKSGITIEGSVSKVFNLIFPSAYAAPENMYEGFDSTKTFQANFDSVATVSVAYNSIFEQIIDLKKAKYKFDTYGIDMNIDPDEEYPNGFVVVHYVNDNFATIGVHLQKLNEDGTYSVEVPLDMVGQYSELRVEAIFKENVASDSITIRSGIINGDDVKAGKSVAKAEVNAVTSYILTNYNTQISQLLTDARVSSPRELDSAASKLQELLTKTESNVQKTFSEYKADPDVFKAASALLTKLAPALYKLRQLDQDFQDRPECWGAFFTYYIFNNKQDPNAVKTYAEALELSLQKKGLDTSALTFDDILAKAEKDEIDNTAVNKIMGPMTDWFFGFQQKGGGVCTLATSEKVESKGK